MALSKFSQFKKERGAIKEARSKEAKVKKFNKVFAEKLKEMGVTSVADLSEDQINSFLGTLKKQEPVNEDRASEIEANVMAAGKAQELGAEGSESEAERAQQYNTVPKGADSEEAADAEELKDDTDEQVGEAKKVQEDDEEEDKGVETKDKGEEDVDKGGEEEDKGDVKVDKEDDAEKADHYAGAVKTDTEEIETDKAEIDALAKDVKFDKDKEKEAEEEEEEVEEVSEMMEAKEIKSDAEFDKYADEVLKKAHPDDFDEKVAKKVKDGLKKKYGDDYGAAVGALTSGFGG